MKFTLTLFDREVKTDLPLNLFNIVTSISSFFHHILQYLTMAITAPRALVLLAVGLGGTSAFSLSMNSALIVQNKGGGHGGEHPRNEPSSQS